MTDTVVTVGNVLPPAIVVTVGSVPPPPLNVTVDRIKYGAAPVVEIDDASATTTTVYSSAKTEAVIDDKSTEVVGDDEFNFTLLFDNKLSQL